MSLGAPDSQDLLCQKGVHYVEDNSVLKREFDFLAVVNGDLAGPTRMGKIMAYHWISQPQVDLVQENRQPTDRFTIDLLTKGFQHIPTDPLSE